MRAVDQIRVPYNDPAKSEHEVVVGQGPEVQLRRCRKLLGARRFAAFEAGKSFHRIVDALQELHFVSHHSSNR